MSDDPKLPLTLEDVQEILRILEKSSFEELRLDIGGLRLNLRRGGGMPASAPWNHSEAANLTSREIPAPAPAQLQPQLESRAPAPGLAEIRAPMLGTFYRAPRPGAAPFVDVGTMLAADTTIGIIEVMKLMNAVPAGIAGEIREICVENGEAVEYGQVLMWVSPR
jgi:acetyl-CoA carboxylase biotin carboxyl carrier protein